MRRALVLAAIAAPALARAEPPSGAALLHYDVSYVHQRALGGGDDAPAAAGSGLALAGFRLHALVADKRPVGYFGGLDLHAGSTNPGGFAYEADLYLIGVGARLGGNNLLGVGTGIGASGAVGTLAHAVDVPVEGFLEVGLGSRLRVLARARALWVSAASRREGGSPTFPWTDEVDATFAVRVGHRYHDFDFPTGNGYFVGVAYHEAEGGRFIGATLGYSVDMGSR
jgi:hypothetical protein